MSTPKTQRFFSLAVLAVGLCRTALGQGPVISSFSHNGELVCTNLEPGGMATVEWAPSVTGPWTNNWGGMDAVRADSNGMIQVSVPMFYRVREVAATNMALIPAGSFTMGDTFSEGDGDERPTHTVHVSAFYMDKYEVSKALWDEVKGWNAGNGYGYDNAGQGKAAGHPVHTVNWYDCVKWCNARSEKEGLAPYYYSDAGLTTIYKTGTRAPYAKWNGNGYRLPTEAEWEKAARGGLNGKRFPWGDTITHSQANYYSTSTDAYDISPTRGIHPAYNDGTIPYTSPVGSFSANGYELHDMTGNVREWCWDWWDVNWFSNAGATQNDTRGPSNGSSCLLRGGSWGHYAVNARCALRVTYAPSYAHYSFGFRCVRGL